MESESHHTRLSAINKLYREPVEKKIEQKKDKVQKEAKALKEEEDPVANERDFSSPVKTVKVYQPKQKQSSVSVWLAIVIALFN